MRAITGYAEAAAMGWGTPERLPAGGYVLKILDVREEHYAWGDVLVLRFDIAQGQYRGFFQKQYDAMQDEFKKWKGTYRLNVPSPKSSSEEDQKKYRRALGFFKSQIEAINQSGGTPIDCSREWDASLMKGRFVGAVFGNKEWEYEGRTGWFTNCDHFVSVQDIQEEKFQIPKDKPLKASSIPKGPSADASGLGSLEDFAEIPSDAVPF